MSIPELVMPYDEDVGRSIPNEPDLQQAPPDAGHQDDEQSLLRALMQDRLLSGGTFVLDAPATPRAVWGDGDRVLWANGEPFMLCGPTGVGKTTIMQQVVLARMGLAKEVLGFTVDHDEGRILYLACDRPSQAQRSMARMVSEEDRSVLDERLRVWKGPLPGDLMRNPDLLFSMAAEAGATTLVVDSLKDIAAKLTDDETGTRTNNAFQACVSRGVQVAVLHHSRKGQADNTKPTKIDDVYGSTWFTAGMGSVLSLWGKPGDVVVELSHLKQPAEQIEPLTVMHDHQRGATTVEDGVDLLAVVRSSRGLTVEAAARILFKVEKPERNQVEKARYQLDKLVAKGLALKQEHGRSGVTGQQLPATYGPAT